MVRCMELIKQFSNDIGMSFGYNKCAILTIKNGKPVETTILDDFLKLCDDEGYKYLGIVESSDFHMKKVKENTAAEYMTR
eukprot:1216514-Ditylum_brightwellii.AAC.1